VLPDFPLKETTVRESGESALFEIAPQECGQLLVTFGITHAVENQSVNLEIHSSEDGETWALKPLATFPAKCYCGEYQMTLPLENTRFLKVKWRVSRWSRSGERPFFRFYIFADLVRSRTPVAYMTVGAA
jgi:hypothetical protein